MGEAGSEIAAAPGGEGGRRATASTIRVVAVCGSLQRRSANLVLVHTLSERASIWTPESVRVVLFDGLRDLPHFNPDLEASGAPEAVIEWRRAIRESDALFMACPEYGHSLPGVLKNGIDWVIGSGELERKIVATAAAVPSPERGLRGLQALRDTLRAVSATIVGGQPIVKGPAFESDVASLLSALIQEIVAR